MPDSSVSASCSWNQTLGIEYLDSYLPLFSRLSTYRETYSISDHPPWLLARPHDPQAAQSPTSKIKPKQNQPGIGFFSPADTLDAITV